MSETTAKVRPRRKIPMIWVVPIVAALLGIWMVVYNYMNQGPEISITFSTAEGIEPGKTKIKALNIELGVVQSVELTADLKRVLVKAKMERFAVPLLRDDTQFWVVRARIGPGGITGLGTILSGGYIQLEAGTGRQEQREFEGLDEPPVTPAGSPGLKLVVESSRATSISPGDPVLFRGYQVGAVETAEFDAGSQRVKYGLFIDEPYDALVNSQTRFWNSSGVSLDAGAGGFRVEFGSLETLILGGIAFDLPEGESAGEPAKNGDRFDLFPNQAAADRKTYEHHTEYVVAFEQTVRGLEPGAPVEFRGVKVGSVQRIMIQEMSVLHMQEYGKPIPVLIRVEPGRLGLPDTAASVKEITDSITGGVARGMRATLKIGNLLTGSALIAIDYFPHEAKAAVGEFEGYPVIPTVSGGIDRLEQQVSRLLQKLNELPVEATLKEIDATLASLREAVDAVKSELTGEKARAIMTSIDAALKKLDAVLDSVSPDSPTADRLNRALNDLNRTLSNVESLTRKLSDKPNSLIFSPPVGEDPVPQGGRPR